MKIIFDTKKLNGLTLTQFFMLAYTEACTKTVKNQIETDKQFLQDNGFLNEYKEITEIGKEILHSIFSNISDVEIDKLVKELREIYPIGIKPNTPYKWTSNPKEIKDKLKRFFMMFSNENFTVDEVIQATKNYVNKMEYSPHMRLLKYFILKTNLDKDKESDLYSEICLLREGGCNSSYENQLI